MDGCGWLKGFQNRSKKNRSGASAFLRLKITLDVGSDAGEEFFDVGDGVVAVHRGDEVEADALGAGRFTLTDVGAVAEAFRIHRIHHAKGAAVFLRLALWEDVELGHLGRGKEHGAGVGAGGHAGTAADAGGTVHRDVGHFLADGQGVGVLCGADVLGDVATGLDDAVEGAAIDDEVLDQGKGLGAEWLHDDGITVLEAAHVQLTGGL